MNYALIFAGGTGQRMNTKSKPKQFLELHGKPIIIYTIEVFENCESIDGIVVVCLKQWIPYMNTLLQKYFIKKVIDVVPGGTSGQESIMHGVMRLHELCEQDSIVLVHDGVRPLIDENTIIDNIRCVQENGNAITVTPAVETIAIEEDDDVAIFNRSKCRLARAPQSFVLKDLYAAHMWAKKESRFDFIDSACLMRSYGQKLHTINGPIENIKITTPMDFYIFRAIEDAKENQQIFC